MLFLRHADREKGYSLLELLIVLGIIGTIILTAAPGMAKLIRDIKEKEQLLMRLRPSMITEEGIIFDNPIENTDTNWPEYLNELQENIE